jgi:hypothetical protein
MFGRVSGFAFYPLFIYLESLHLSLALGFDFIIYATHYARLLLRVEGGKFANVRKIDFVTLQCKIST